MTWYALTKPEGSALSEISLKAVADSDSPWFDGHFPHEPILPGIAQMAMVYDALRLVLPEAGRIAGVRRVRFKRVIRPGEPLSVVILPGKRKHVYQFRIHAEEELACSGLLIIKDA